jgi:tRNA pseudouridine65 synthase
MPSPLTILFQDEYFVAIDKPAGLLVHPGRDPEPPEQIAMKRLRDQLGQRVYTIHRLDRPTSGVLLFALDPRVQGMTQQSFEGREVEKTYLAIVEGMPPDSWENHTALQKDPESPQQQAATRFRRLAHHPAGHWSSAPELSLSLLEARPETGRFHQIRRHLLHDGFSIVGDFRYSGAERSYQLGAILGTGDRMLLQAHQLIFPHPLTGQHCCITAPPDPDFLKCFPDLLIPVQ